MSRERIVIVAGGDDGAEFALDGELTIGRGDGNSIVVDDRQVSRQHARVEQTPAGTILKDLDSGNGVFVADRRVVEYKLSDGDEFRIGPVTLRYEGEAQPIEKTAGSGSHVNFEDGIAGTVEASSVENVYQTLFASPRETVDAEQLQTLQKRLQAIYEANQIISQERDLHKLFARVMEQLFSLVHASNGVILLAANDGALESVYEHIEGEDSEIVVSRSIMKRAHDDGEAVLVYDAGDDARFDASASIASGKIASAMCVPLVYQDEKLGVIYVATRQRANAFTQNDLELMVALAGPAGIAIKNAAFVEELEEDFQTTLKVLANAVELKDHYTVGHTWRVTNFSVAIAEELGWDEEKLKEVEMGGVLHDVGKIGVPEAVLCKPGRLTKEEFALMKVHPEKGASLMQDSKKLKPLIPYCLYHHERFDGNGYPHGLAGEDIPIEGRVVAVADTFDAMTSNRPYRKGLDPKIAIEEIEKCKGTQFDPECADAFIRAYNKGKISHILQEYHQRDEKSIVCPFCSTYVSVPVEAELGHVLQCEVCHRSMKLGQINDAYYGERLAETEVS